MSNTTLKPYPAYKPAGVPWLQQVPEHWELLRTKNFLREVNVRSKTGKEDLLSVSQYTGITRRKDSMRGGSGLVTTAKTLVGYKLVEPGDLVMNIMLAWRGSQAVSPIAGITSPAYSVFRVTTDQVIPQYLHYIYRTDLYNGLFKTVSTGVMDSRLRLYPEVFFRLPTLLPPPDEQHLIVRYLHALDAKVKRYIRTKRTLIARLQEQKQAIIQRAVTRGLDPNVKLKPSGVEWLGEVPEHWVMKPAKYVFREIDERSKTGREELLSVSHITGVTPRSQKEVTMFMAKSYAGHKVCREGDLVINTMWAWAGALGVSQHIGLVSPAYAVYRPISKLHHDAYLDLLLRTNSYKDQFFCESTGLRKSRLRMYPEKFFRVGIPCPSLEEQQGILDFLASATQSLDRTLQKAQQEVAVMNEYHTRLIADVVTGAVDVREAAQALPEQAIELTADEPMEEEPLSMAAGGEDEYGTALEN